MECMNCIILKLISFFILVFAKGNTCEDTHCSQVFDYVCGAIVTNNGDQVIVRYQNICYLNKMRCRLKYIIGLCHLLNIRNKIIISYSLVFLQNQTSCNFLT